MADDRSEKALRAMAAAIDLDLPPETIDGVCANVGLLAQHAAQLADFPLPDDPQP